MNTRIEYMIGDKITDVIENAIYNFYRGKVDFSGPDPEREVIVESGIAGYRQIRSGIEDMCVKSGLVISASQLDNSEQSFTSWIIPFLANVKFKHDPIFDSSVEVIDVSYVNGYRLYSYNYRVTDVNSGEVIDIVPTGVREPRGSIRYYWINEFVRHIPTVMAGEVTKQYHQSVSTDHPFYHAQNKVFTTSSGTDYKSIVNWKEITKDEYELFNKINTK